MGHSRLINLSFATAHLLFPIVGVYAGFKRLNTLAPHQKTEIQRVKQQMGIHALKICVGLLMVAFLTPLTASAGPLPSILLFHLGSHVIPSVRLFALAHTLGWSLFKEKQFESQVAPRRRLKTLAAGIEFGLFVLSIKLSLIAMIYPLTSLILPAMILSATSSIIGGLFWAKIQAPKQISAMIQKITPELTLRGTQDNVIPAKSPLVLFSQRKSVENIEPLNLRDSFAFSMGI